MPNKKLLFSVTEKDLEIQTFHAGGPGGQNQNKRNTGVRIIHAASGAVGESREERSQLQNKRLALEKLSKSPKFKLWITRRIYAMDNVETAEESVDKEMQPENLKFETLDENGKWIEIEKLDA